MHPPLHLSLAAPDEPGFILEHVQVYNMKEVWSILEVRTHAPSHLSRPRSAGYS